MTEKTSHINTPDIQTGIFAKLISAAITVIAIVTTPLSAHGQAIRFANEAADTARITRILVDECKQKSPGNVERLARQFIGTPYAGGTLEHSPETLTINLDSLDCTTFVETVLALAYTAAENRPSWRDFAYNLRRMRYRNGETDGYASRLHYPSAWVVDNVSRGNLKELTGDLAGVRYNVKTLDYMSSHRDSYAALTDSANFVAAKRMESGFSNHRYPVLKTAQVKEKVLLPVAKSGDVVMFTTSAKGLDVSHMGILFFDGKNFRFIHASQKAGKVIEEPLTLSEYLKRHRSEGIRIIRLTPY